MKKTVKRDVRQTDWTNVVHWMEKTGGLWER